MEFSTIQASEAAHLTWGQLHRFMTKSQAEGGTPFTVQLLRGYPPVVPTGNGGLLHGWDSAVISARVALGELPHATVDDLRGLLAQAEDSATLAIAVSGVREGALLRDSEREQLINVVVTRAEVANGHLTLIADPAEVYR